MSTNTYVALDKVTVGTATSTITFTGINQGYTDLVVVYQGAAAAAANMFVRVGNGSLDTGSNYSLTQMTGSGSSASSSRLSSQAEIKISEGNFVNTNEQCNIIMNFQNYSNATTYKTVLSRFNSAGIGVQAQVSLWRSTSAINTISVYASQNFNTGTTISLYGIAASGVSPAAKATGGAIYADDTYYYHVFGSTGTFTPLSSLTADVLVVAGGGGGGDEYGGGGGAGALRYWASESLTATAYTCTVGGGGAGGSSSAGSTGGVSTFGSLSSSSGGGGGGSRDFAAATSGGSGGGGAGWSSNAGGAGSTGGNAGSNGTDSGSNSKGGGGGGAGAVGGTSSTSVGGAGGAGLNTYSDWASATGTGASGYYAGGGGGGGASGTAGAGGAGGGAAGLIASGGTAFNGVINTGGGGGGGGNGTTTGGAGGAGIIIVRYSKA